MRLTAITGESLDSIKFCFPKQILDTIPSFSFRVQWPNKDEPAVCKKLKNRGWCKSLFRYLCDDLGNCTAEYTALIDATDASPMSHETCSVDECLARHIDKEDYVTKHTPESCQCSFKKPILTSIVYAYESGSSPLINLAMMRDNQTNFADSVTVYRNSSDTPFIAFSHVMV